MENFDNNEFNKQMNIIKIICILLVVVSAIGFLFAGDMINSIAIDNDTDDVGYKIDGYYGTYYWISDKYECWSLKLSSSGCHIVCDTGIGTAEKDYSCRYVSSDDAGQIGVSVPVDFYGCEAIVVYEYDWTSWSYMLWITNDGIVLDNRAEIYTLTTDELTFKDVCNDPQDYYGKYVLDEQNYVEVKADGTAKIHNNGNDLFYEYSFVNAFWLARHMAEEDNSWTDHTLIMYRHASTQVFLFYVQSDGTLMLKDWIYTKTSSD